MHHHGGSLSVYSDFDEELDSLQGLSADMIVEACVRCLEIIDPDFQSSKTLPQAMSARYRMCSTLANAIQVCKSIICMYMCIHSGISMRDTPLNTSCDSCDTVQRHCGEQN